MEKNEIKKELYENAGKLAIRLGWQLACVVRYLITLKISVGAQAVKLFIFRSRTFLPKRVMVRMYELDDETTTLDDRRRTSIVAE